MTGPDNRCDHRHWRWNAGDIDEMRTDKLRVEIYRSPTGRSQRVYVNGYEIDWRGLDGITT